MSGIAGLYYFDNRPVTSDEIGNMTDTLAHRGPDNGGIWQLGPVGFGHRMLWTTPESLDEKLPLVSRDGNFAITSDVRLDNRDELISKLKFEKKDLKKVSDSELVLAAYMRWGCECPKHLLGAFVFVIWDAIEQHLFAARDHFGLRPFYYHLGMKFFAFASEIKAILMLNQIPCKLNELRVAEFLVPLFDDKEITFYEYIQRLPPASCLLVKNDEHRIWSFWSLDQVAETRLSADEEYQEAFVEVFTESVHCRLRSAYPVGAMLSGGLDSSSISTVARDFLSTMGDQKIHTFSAIFDEVKECDERAYIQPVLDQGGFDPHFLHADRIGPLTDIDHILWTQDEAIFSPNRFMHWALYKQASEQNVRVLLDGIDGDTTISHGLTRLVELALGWQWKTLSQEVTAIAQRSGNSLWRVWQVAVLKPLLPIWLYDRWRSIRGLPLKYRINNPTINPDFAERMRLDEHFKDSIQVWLQPERREYQVHKRQLEWGLHAVVLEGLNKTASYLEVEPRYPFFDKRLVEFCLSLPPKYKLRNGWTRWILRTSLNDILPTEVQWRKMKTSLGPNFTHGFLEMQRMQIEDVVYGDYSEIGNYIDKKALPKVYERYRSTKSNTDEMYLWTAVILSTWLKQSVFSKARNGLNM